MDIYSVILESGGSEEFQPNEASFYKTYIKNDKKKTIKKHKKSEKNDIKNHLNPSFIRNISKINDSMKYLR